MTQDTGTATLDPASTGTSSTDDVMEVHGVAESETPASPAPPSPSPAPKARRDNPLVAGLVRAMRDAAQAAKDESLARFAEVAKARVEGITTDSADAAADIRRQSEADIAGIREWSKAEMARIREETEERIADRKRRLELEIDEHAARVEHRIVLVQDAVATFEAEMERFFTALLAEDDPARLAGFAEQLPEPPTLEFDASVDAWTPARTLDDDDAAAAEADFLIGAEEAADATTSLKTGLATADADLDVVERLATFTDPAVVREEPETTRLSVVGLISVASIAGFKRALGRAPGVTAVSVASGPGGDFVFTVQHLASTDLRTLIPELGGYAASITGDADGVLSVAASEPGEAS